MDEETIKKAGISPLIKILHKVAELYPIKGSVNRDAPHTSAQDDKSLSDTVLFLARLGVSSLVSFGAGADDKDPDTVVVVASPPWRIGLPAKDYYSDARVVKSYEETLANIIGQLHPDLRDNRQDNLVASSKAKNFAQDVVNFEKNLAAASPDAEDRDDVTVS